MVDKVIARRFSQQTQRYIMTTAMSGSLVVLFWSFVQLSCKQGNNICYSCIGFLLAAWCLPTKCNPRLLLVVQTTIALSLTQMLAGFFRDSDVPAASLHYVELSTLINCQN